jgi:DNA-binding NarL/FixJ family response regulator
MSRVTGDRAPLLGPYFHPTTFCVIDDNERFLRSLELDVPPHIALRTFGHPEHALAWVNQHTTPAPLAERAMTLAREGATERTLRFDLDLIAAELANPARFERISVVLVDYAMPFLNGIEFFEGMTDPFVRRAMLTGVADERVAVDLFNRGIIHNFLQKQRAQDLDAMVEYALKMESEYFRQSLARLRHALDAGPNSLLADTAVAAHVHALMRDEQLVEYYLVDEPPGFIMLRGDGTVVRLILCDPEERARQIAFAEVYGAPTSVQRGLQAGQLVASFGSDSPLHYHGDEAYPWDDYLVPAEPVPGSNVWIAGLQRDPPMDIDFDPAAASYNAYLKRLRLS